MSIAFGRRVRWLAVILLVVAWFVALIGLLGIAALAWVSNASLNPQSSAPPPAVPATSQPQAPPVDQPQAGAPAAQPPEAESERLLKETPRGVIRGAEAMLRDPTLLGIICDDIAILPTRSPSRTAMGASSTGGRSSARPGSARRKLLTQLTSGKSRMTCRKASAIPMSRTPMIRAFKPGLAMNATSICL